MGSLVTLVPPLKSKPLIGMKWMDEWVDVHPFPLVRISVTYRKTELESYKMSVSGHHRKKSKACNFVSAVIEATSVLLWLILVPVVFGDH